MSTTYAEVENNVEGAVLDTTGGVDSKFKLPKKSYKLRCIDVVFKRSKSKKDPKTGLEVGNNPMLERKWEIVEPEKVRIRIPNTDQFEEKICAGIQSMDWLVMSAKTGFMVKRDSEALGVDIPDDEVPNVKQYIGKEMNAIIETNVVNAIDEETNEPIKRSDGTNVVRYQHNMGEKYL